MVPTEARASPRKPRVPILNNHIPRELPWATVP
jgi:hypothetical protein